MPSHRPRWLLANPTPVFLLCVCEKGRDRSSKLHFNDLLILCYTKNIIVGVKKGRYIQTLKRLLSVLAVAPLLGLVFNTSAAHASGCKIVTNPADSGTSFVTDGYSFEASVSFTTGDSSSTCSDVNVRYVKSTYGGAPASTSCAVQYLSGGVWHTDSAGSVWVQYNISTPTVLGYGYANNATIRIGCIRGLGWTYPTFEALV